MHVYVFAGAERLLGFTQDQTGDNLPKAHGPWRLTNRLQMSEEDDPRPLVQTRDCLDDIEMHGFHITKRSRRVTDTLDE